MRARSMRLPFAAIVGLALANWCVASLAQTPGDVRIDITSGLAPKLPIRLENWSTAGERNAQAMGAEAQDVLAHDLETSAVFAVTRAWQPAVGEATPQALVGGKWSVRGDQVRLDGTVADFPGRRPILEKSYRGTLGEWRHLVHQFADDITLQFTGQPGVANTRIAFVVREGRDKELWVMDADGFGPQPLSADHSIVLSPSWSPDGSLILYTSYRDGRGAKLWVMSPADRKPFLVSGRAGLNTSGQYSPDGREIVCTLSQDGNAEIYLLDARGASPRRLTNQRSIDTSPCWSPTGQEIAFTSDRSGTPQVYVMDRVGGNLRRLNYDVSYTDSPAWSPDGSRIAFVSRAGNGFDIYVCRADGSGTQRVATGGRNENPHWSPDGRHLVFASTRDGGSGLYVTDLDGTPPRAISTGGRRAFSPAWSPRPVVVNSGR